MTTVPAARTGEGTPVLNPSRVAVLKELAAPADLAELVAAYAADAATAVEALRVAVAGDDLGRFVAIAHRFWGSCVTVGATRLAAVLLDLEHRVAGLRLEPRAAPIELVAAEADAAIAALGQVFRTS
jgi:HPt (histidine-containing phosphotransfer) domain-containing protein